MCCVCVKFVYTEGEHVATLKSNLARTRDALLRWSPLHSGFYLKEIDAIRTELGRFYWAADACDYDVKLRLESKLVDLLRQEETVWRQRSKSFWLKDGDLNTKFYHRVASDRKRVNHITGLFNKEGAWCESEAELKDIVMSYFQELFSSSIRDIVEFGGPLLDKVISCDINARLEADVSKSEVHRALSMMHPTKAPGPDGFSPFFFQRHWDIIGDSVTEAVRSFLRSDDYVKQVNETLVVLIPKVPVPQSMQQLRPISLCNVIYKIGSKVLANRLKPWMEFIISPQQAVFVPGRLITDNSLIAFEIAHNMKQRRTGGKVSVQ